MTLLGTNSPWESSSFEIVLPRGINYNLVVILICRLRGSFLPIVFAKKKTHCFWKTPIWRAYQKLPPFSGVNQWWSTTANRCPSAIPFEDSRCVLLQVKVNHKMREDPEIKQQTPQKTMICGFKNVNIYVYIYICMDISTYVDTYKYVYVYPVYT